LLSKSFEIDPNRITPEAMLFQDLDLDSIDAIDMVVSLQEWTGRRVPEDALRGVRTVADVVSLVETHLADGPDPSSGEAPA
jgi:acyl carrier protein